MRRVTPTRVCVSSYLCRAASVRVRIRMCMLTLARCVYVHPPVLCVCPGCHAVCPVSVCVRMSVCVPDVLVLLSVVPVLCPGVPCLFGMFLNGFGSFCYDMHVFLWFDLFSILASSSPVRGSSLASPRSAPPGYGSPCISLVRTTLCWSHFPPLSFSNMLAF